MRFKFLISIILIQLNLLAVVSKPGEYFQQYVNYEIVVRLNIDLHQLDVKETLIYTNNSPDTLSEIYFHLYLNKYKKGSLVFPNITYDRGSIEISKVLENGISNNSGTTDRTLYNLQLQSPLYPGHSVRFEFDFKAVLPMASGRLGYFGDHFDVGNWYITPVVYDRFGWHLHQHLDNEFYQEWGDFLVNIYVPKGFIVGATGNLMNPTEAYKDTLSEYKNRYLVLPEDTTLTLWQFEAKNVHDFAWTTDPAYKLIQADWNGITFNVLVMDYNADSWQQVAEWGPKALAYLSENFGMYPYDQITVADTYIKAGGIEYPQITFINDMIHPEYESSQFKATIIHEMAHNWYYGLLGSNQTEEGWMDEGFTTFAEIKTMEALFGRYNNYSPPDRGWLANRFSLPDDDRSDNARSYLKLAMFDLDKDPVNLHPDYMRKDNNYVLEYSKTALILFMLEYTLGDSLFARAMLDYYDRWRFKHPYPHDFITSVEKSTERDLNWFFEQWLNTNRKLDYSVEEVTGEWEIIDTNRKYHAYILFRRNGEIFMPIDFDVTLATGEVLQFQIPVDNFPKPERDRTSLPYWHFSHEQYQASLILESEVESVEIDPSLRLVDVNRLNNVSDFFPKQNFYFMKYGSSTPPIDKYVWELWPTAHYNDYDKLKLGFNLNGSYLDIDHKLDLWFWYKTARGNVDFDANYQTPVNWFGKITHFNLNVFTLDGRQGGQFGISHNLNDSWRDKPKFNIEFGISSHKLFNRNYLMASWSPGQVNSVFTSWSMDNSYYRGWKPKNLIQFNFISSTLGSDYNFNQTSLEILNKLWDNYSDWEIDLRFFMGYSEGKVPLQYLFNLSGDNSWGEFQQSFYRSKGSLPYPWRRNGHLYKKGGGNVRGYTLYDNIAILGKRIVAINLDITMANPLAPLFLPIIEDMKPVFFTDVGEVWDGSMPSVKSFKKSAGFSIFWESEYHLDYLFNLERVRLDFPLWLSDVSKNENNIEFRWLIRFDFRY